MATALAQGETQVDAGVRQSRSECRSWGAGEAWVCLEELDRKARLGSYRKLGASLIEREASDAAMAWGIQYSRWNEEGLLRGKEEEGRPHRAKRGWQRALLLFTNQWGAFAGSEMSVDYP